MMIRIEGESAYVLHTRLYRETSLIVDVLTEHQGRVSLIAKGARRPKSPWKGLLQPFVPLTLSYLGRADLKTLTHCELLGLWQHMPAAQLPSVLYMNELLVKLIHPQHPMPELFRLYTETLSGIAATMDTRPLLRRFEKYLLSYLGYDLILDRDSDQQPIMPEAYYFYHLEAGATHYEGDAQANSRVFSGHVLLALAHDQYDDPAQASAMRFFLGSLLSQLYAGELVTRQLIYQGSTS